MIHIVDVNISALVFTLALTKVAILKSYSGVHLSGQRCKI